MGSYILHISASEFDLMMQKIVSYSDDDQNIFVFVVFWILLFSNVCRFDNFAICLEGSDFLRFKEQKLQYYINIFSAKGWMEFIIYNICYFMWMEKFVQE